ncbi:hypothetical protein ACP_1791 [Acidobacterium capsulatum ATCC 51196]|uniref:Uncharacterized protein n=1 Tax=Acidobacterium capsulatum (strain ATCC 51196 / DSM 11244 / BCRC 80197 / JCM 7670 / NBRC 15755 / NCIMB 13165 / 161) TaxID=240015 RepID=C1F7Q8_ACIC5|nr:hypothetical protein ACP_1791 [Acidobacterium capsulatum ATCC 51196]
MAGDFPSPRNRCDGGRHVKGMRRQRHVIGRAQQIALLHHLAVVQIGQRERRLNAVNEVVVVELDHIGVFVVKLGVAIGEAHLHGQVCLRIGLHRDGVVLLVEQGYLVGEPPL